MLSDVNVLAGAAPFHNSTSSQVLSESDLDEVVRVLNTITEIMAATAEIRAIRRDEVYPIYLKKLNQFVVFNCRSNSRKGTRVYLPPRWIQYLPFQNFYGRSLCPPSHHFTSI